MQILVFDDLDSLGHWEDNGILKKLGNAAVRPESYPIVQDPHHSHAKASEEYGHANEARTPGTQSQAGASSTVIAVT